jgi:fructosamine-3-kinase
MNRPRMNRPRMNRPRTNRPRTHWPRTHWPRTDRPGVSRPAPVRWLTELTGLPIREARPVGAQHGCQHLMLTLTDGRRAFAKAIPPEGPARRLATIPPPAAPDPASSRDSASSGDPASSRDSASSGDSASSRDSASSGDSASSRDGAAARAPAVADAFAAEANSLRWLAEAAAVPVPEVLAAAPAALVISLIPPGRPTPDAAFGFGADLARLHAAGAPAFGAPWPGVIASLPLDNTRLDNTRLDNTRLDNTPLDRTPLADAPGDWPRWYAHRRLLPFLARAVDAGALGSEDARLVETVIDRIASVAGPAEPPSRIHGDCWAGNVLWSGGRGWLIDPAAHGGHRETDLAMLALFGAPGLDRILAGYTDTVPLAPGWRSRIPLHQLHPLLVHACLFGAAYREEVRSAARAVLAL